MGGGRPSARLQALAALLVVAALLVGGVALDDSGGDQTGAPREERDNRDRAELKTTTTVRPTTTTATTTIPGGPVFGAPVGASLLLVDPESSRRATLVDLDTGARHEVRVQADDPFGVVPVRRGIVVARAGSAKLVRLDPDATADPDGVLGIALETLGPADRVLASGSLDSVWLLRLAGAPTPGVTAQLVDLSGHPLAEVLEVPVDFPVGATGEGVLFEDGGRALLTRRSGTSSVAVGRVLDLAGSRVALRTCDDLASCGVEVRDLTTGRTQRLAGPAPGAEYGTLLLAPDGRVAVLDHTAVFGMALFDADGNVVGQGPPVLLDGEPLWLPGSLGLLVPSGSGFRHIRPAEGGLVSEPVRALDGIQAGVGFVIPR